MMARNEFHGLYEHTTGTTSRIIDNSLVRFNHFRDEVYNALWGIEFSFSFPFSQGELAQEVFIYAPNDVLLFVFKCINVVDGVEQGSQLTHIHVQAREIVVRQSAF